MFYTCLSVILFTGVGKKGVSLTAHGDPPDRDPLEREPPGQRSAWSETPLDRESPRETLLDSDSLDRDPPPPHRRVKSTRYVSYWNAFSLVAH